MRLLFPNLPRVWRYLVYLAVLGCCLAFGQAPPKNITVFLIGDSTMANKASSTFPETGWGMPFT